MSTRLPNADELVELADRNLGEFDRAQALWTRKGEVLVHDDAQLVASGTRFPAGMFNCLYPLGAAPDAARAQGWLDRALDFYAARGRGFSVYRRGAGDEALAAACAALGMQEAESVPGMLLDAKVPEPELAKGVRIARVTSAAGVADFVSVAAPAYAPLSLPEPVAHAIFAEPARLLRHELALFVGYADGVPASAAMHLLSHGIAGIYWVATRPDLQRRGLAEAVTRRCSNDAFERGAACVILQATRFGEPVYRRIGYRGITRYSYAFLTRERVAALRPADSPARPA